MRPALQRAHLWLMVAALYFTQGVPLGLAMEALPAMLRRDGAPLDSLAFLPLVGLPWVLKFLWAAQVDNRWNARLGRRRSWLLPMQALATACLLGAALLGLSAASAPLIVALAALGSLASATQDIATDGMLAERFDGAALGRANALQVGGTMVGFFTGGSGVLMLSGMFGQRAALLALAAIGAASLLLVVSWRETALGAARPAAVPAARKASLRGFIGRPGAPALLGIAFLSSMTAVAGYGLSKLLLVDAGWPLEAVGQVGVAGGMVTVLLGCGGGAWLIGRHGARRVFLLGIGASAAAAGLWLWLAAMAAPMPSSLVWLATALGCFGAGCASVSMLTMAMQFASQSGQAGTDMTAVQSMRDGGEILTSSTLTGVAAAAGYGGSFALGIACALLAMLLARRLAQQRQPA
ncbi:RhtX/FptX family siderophore transporter [Janthinobacterium sp. 1_2014MBL_MicDiv]|uniref:RhtX/FptX family siderophore transporter n=1 Tax=Janthinobacterium sp. 1_2014MBL_MicDiv TaxID=1644131 RepID=UPI0008F4DDA1|nr:RhtX/FptX family siderophore transporter [Janthinobacterium sp. 1_2014MBL_MicDiv]APA70361.1 MFS transporter [Janthinobacterium sp. 1_2014MBL_MicDiv]